MIWVINVLAGALLGILLREIGLSTLGSTAGGALLATLLCSYTYNSAIRSPANLLGNLLDGEGEEYELPELDIQVRMPRTKPPREKDEE